MCIRDRPNNDITLDKSIALTVESKAPFTGYLRGYSLAHYQNNKWHAVNENYDCLLYTSQLIKSLKNERKESKSCWFAT